MSVKPASLAPGLNATISVVTAPGSIVGLIAADHGIFPPKPHSSKRHSVQSNIFVLTAMSYDEVYAGNSSTTEESGNEVAQEKGSAGSWIFETLIAESNGRIHFTKRVPPEITSWTVSAISMSPEFGFRFSNYEQITVDEQFFMRVNLPSVVRYGEILRVEVLIFNYLLLQDEDVNVVVTLYRNEESDDFEYIEKISDCSFVPHDDTEREAEVTVSPNSVKSVSFLIRPLKTGAIKLKFKAVEDSSATSHEIEKVLKVKHEGIAKYLSKSMLLDLRTEKTFSPRFDFLIPSNAVWKSISIEGSIVGDLLGPSLLNATSLM